MCDGKYDPFQEEKKMIFPSCLCSMGEKMLRVFLSGIVEVELMYCLFRMQTEILLN